MYASHFAYKNDAGLGAPECDLLMQLVRDREHRGFYGAKITGGGQGGTVAVLADISPSTDAAIAEILATYERETGNKPEALTGSSPGAWATGTVLVNV
jgi:L-arabinokinase